MYKKYHRNPSMSHEEFFQERLGDIGKVLEVREVGQSAFIAIHVLAGKNRDEFHIVECRFYWDTEDRSRSTFCCKVVIDPDQQSMNACPVYVLDRFKPKPNKTKKKLPAAVCDETQREERPVPEFVPAMAAISNGRAVQLQLPCC